MICALDIEDHLSANMRAAEESRLVLEAEYSGHSETNCGNHENKLSNLVVLQILRASLCKILISSFAHKMDFAHTFSVDFF